MLHINYISIKTYFVNKIKIINILKHVRVKLQIHVIKLSLKYQ